MQARIFRASQYILDAPAGGFGGHATLPRPGAEAAVCVGAGPGCSGQPLWPGAGAEAGRRGPLL